MKKAFYLIILSSFALNLHSMSRLIKFDKEKGINTGCGKIYEMVSTDVYEGRSGSFSASLALARQRGKGQVHTHNKLREVYMGTQGTGVVHWGEETEHPITSGNAFNIAPGTIHGLSTKDGEEADVLVAVNPRFKPEDYYPHDKDGNRHEEKPPFFSHEADVIVEEPHFKVRKFMVPGGRTYSPTSAFQLLCILNGTGKVHLFKEGSIVASDLARYDSVALQQSDFLDGTGETPLSGILVEDPTQK